MKHTGRPNKPLVSVIIPCYNYGDRIGRAIESVKNQSYTNWEIIIVDDGSSDGSDKVIERLIQGDERIRLIRQENRGVAFARNRGVFASRGEYICCLDADDAIEPLFLEACVTALEEDQSIAIAYCGLRWIKPDGTTGISAWPGEYNYDEMLQGKNQIPTCNVARRVVWERLGGQRPRYAPYGAGEEDAEMWLRAGAYGFRGRKVTDAPLFVYSWMSGRVSGNRAHKVSDWRGFHPWVKDGKHPLPSAATAKRFSHPARAYDAPLISVIIPLGIGHETLLYNALDSLEAQDMRLWEAIVVCDATLPRFPWTSKDDPQEAFEEFRKAYPYPKYIISEGAARGAGWARNRGAEAARAPALLFLDADDELAPGCLSQMYIASLINPGHIIYSDYLMEVRATPEDVPELERWRIVDYNARTGTLTLLMRAADYDCQRAQAQPQEHNPYHWNLITSLVPKKMHQETGGFDESMTALEDWDYWIRLAMKGYCFKRIAVNLIKYNSSSGTRRLNGASARGEIFEYLKNKYKGEKAMPCACSDSQPNVNTYGGAQQTRQAMQPEGNRRLNTYEERNLMNINDQELILVRYNSANIAPHPIYGAVTGTFYGYRAGGDIFLVHKSDVASFPDLFIAVEQAAPAPRPEPAPPPEAAQPDTDDENEEDITIFDDIDLNDIPITEVSGVSEHAAKMLQDAGIKTAADLMNLGYRGMIALGMRRDRARAIMDGLDVLIMASQA